MKTKIYILYTIMAVVAAIQLLPVACTDSYGDWQPDEKYTSPFTLSLELPRPKTAELTTRAMNDEQESQIEEITLLLFKAGTGNTELLESTYAIPGTALTRNSPGGRFYTTIVTLATGTYSSFIVLANSEATLIQNPLLTQGTPRSQIEEELLWSLGDGARWNATPPNPRYFPMWGVIEGGSTGLVITGAPQNYSVKLHRMLASIDIVIEQEDEQGQPLPAFDLDKIHLCNFYRNGRMIPISTTTHYDGTKLLDVSLPADADRLAYTDPLVYNGNLADATSAPNIIIRNEIYIFEQLPSDGEEKSKKPFLIIEGVYEDTGYPSFYRIDFVERLHEEPTDPLKAEDNFLPLIRNYTYQIVVKEILGPGYRSFEDAATCKPFNTVNEIFRFDDSDSESVQFDGKYFLSVSDETIRYDRDESTQTFVVKTDSPLGWQIGNIIYSGGDGSTGWLQMDKNGGQRGENGEVSLTAAAYNPTVPDPTPREATFTVTSGRMEYTIQVIQSHLQGISLEIVDEAGEPLTEIRFRSNPRNPTLQLPERKFTVRWSAPNGCRMGVVMLGNRIFPFDTTGDNAIQEGRILNPGEENHTFTIQPTAFTETETEPGTGNPFLQEGATITFQVDNGEETITKNLYIRHECLSIVIDNPEMYSYMGHEESFTIYSNTSWVLHKVESELQDLFLNPATGADFKELIGTTGGYNTNTGDLMTYRVQKATTTDGIYGLEKAGRKMVLTFRDTEGVAPDQTTDFIATTPDANCYLVPAGNTVHIPLRKLFWIWERELDRKISHTASGTLSAQIVWQTAAGLIQSVAVNPSGSPGDYRDYTLDVSTGNIPYGNAIVAVRSSGEILWSFHIWVSDYDPQANGATFTAPRGARFMDRNIGSDGNYMTTLTPECLGLYYQWGRKDPFPGGNRLGDFYLNDGTDQYNLYDAGNNPVHIKYEQIAPDTEKNLENSIHNPTWFYTAPGNSDIQDWYTSKTEMIYQNDFLWKDKKGRKTVYDPCPAGWRVSSYNDMESLYKNAPQVTYTFNSYATFTWTGNSLIFPGAGNIDDGYYYAGNASAMLWDRETYNQNGIFEAFGTSIGWDGMNFRKLGMSARCVADTHNWYP